MTAAAIFKILIFVVALSITAISAIIKELNKKAAAKRAKDARERQHTEMLRTGRAGAPSPVAEVLGRGTAAGGPAAAQQAQPLPVSEPDAKRRLQELAQRRRAELERLARQQMGGAAARPSAPAAPTMRPGGPADMQRRNVPPPIPRPMPAQSRPQNPARPMQPPPIPQQRAQPMGPTRPQQTAQQKQREQAKRREQSGRGVPRETQFPRNDAVPTKRLVADAPVAKEPVDNTVRAGGPKGIIDVAAIRAGSPEDLRKTFLLSEIFGAPKSMRHESGE